MNDRVQSQNMFLSKDGSAKRLTVATWRKDAAETNVRRVHHILGIEVRKSLVPRNEASVFRMT